MCHPAVMVVASMAMSLYQGQQQAKAANQQAEYEQAVQRNNNIMAERAQEDTVARGKRDEALRRMQTKQDVGNKKSSLSASGFDVNTGSALTAQSDVAAMGDVEALTIRSNYQRDAYEIGVNNTAERAASEGRVYQSKVKAQNSIISGATSALSTGYSGWQSGAFK